LRPDDATGRITVRFTGFRRLDFMRLSSTYNGSTDRIMA